jgi:sugar phosphate isomerase/epimerase
MALEETELAKSVDGAAALPPLSLAHLGFLEVPPAEFVRIAADAGFSSVGLRINKSAPGGIEYPYRSKSAEARAVLDAVRETGTSVLYVETIGLARATVIRDAEPMLDIGAALGATHMCVSGDDKDFSVVAEKLAALCELSKPYGIAIDIEYMPFRAVASLADAIKVVGPPGTTGGKILVDLLHHMRSGGSVHEVAELDRHLLGSFQLCDGPLQRPPSLELLIAEARGDRLLPGEGNFPISAVLNALPDDAILGVEVPTRPRHPHVPAVELCRAAAEATRASLLRARIDRRRSGA